MALSDSALITVATYVTIGRLDTPDATETTQIEWAIEAASDYIETACNRTFLSGSLASEVFDGKGYASNIPSAHTLYVTEQAPITSSPVLYTWDGDSWEPVTVSTYSYRATDGEVYFPGSAGGNYYTPEGYSAGVGNYYFIAGVRNYKVEYEYGYNGVDNIPYDIQGAVAAIAKGFNMSYDHIGVESSNMSDRSHTFSLDELPLIVQQTVNKYIR